MARTRQLVLFVQVEKAAKPRALGTRREVVAAMAPFNTAPDGSKERTLAYGPGYIVQLPMGDEDDEVKQALVALNEEEIAWPALSRMCKALGWAMMDPETGRVFVGE